MESERASWDEVWMRMACEMAHRSKCVRAQVGAVIVSADQRVLATGYNGPPRGLDAEGPCVAWCPRARKVETGEELSGVYDDCHAAHAESNALARGDYSQMQGSTLYVSTSMCKGCSKSVANSGVERVVFGDTGDGSDAHRLPKETEDFIRACGLTIDRWNLATKS